MRPHLAFLDYWYQRHKPESYASDLLDLTEHDLPHTGTTTTVKVTIVGASTASQDGSQT
jgi:hypothetical protein